MAEKDESRRGGLMVAAVDPIDGRLVELQLSYDRLQFMKRLGVRALKETAFLVPEVLQRPTAIFEGLRREVDEDHGVGGSGWRC